MPIARYLKNRSKVKSQMAGAHSNGKTHLGVLGLLGGVFLGKTPVPKMKNGRNPPFHQKTHTGSWGFWAGVYGGDLRFPNEKWQGPLLHKKGREKKGKRGRELEKTLASSKILTHGLGSLKGSPQCEKKKSTAQRRSRCLDLIASIISIEVKVKKSVC